MERTKWKDLGRILGKASDGKKVLLWSEIEEENSAHLDTTEEMS